MEFFQRRWVKITSLIPMVLYTVYILTLTQDILSRTVFRQPNLVFAGTDLIGAIGYLVFLFTVFVSGASAVLAAYFLRSVYRFLYIGGVLAMAYAVLLIPLTIVFTVDVEFHPAVPNDEFVMGTWLDEYYRLTLQEDHTYTLEQREGGEWNVIVTPDSGQWRRDGNDLWATNHPFHNKTNWEIYECDGYYFITYNIPGNFDAWSGNLGLMRESEWPGDK